LNGQIGPPLPKCSDEWADLAARRDAGRHSVCDPKRSLVLLQLDHIRFLPSCLKPICRVEWPDRPTEFGV